jgi:hypothetical protein
MEKGGFEALVESLAKPPAGSKETATPQPPPLVASPGEEAARIRQSLVPRPKLSESSHPADLADSIAAAEQVIQRLEEAEASRARVVSVPLEKWEWEALAAYHALVRTPRGVTRLVNTYRLVRAGLTQDEWANFCGDKKTNGEFRITMLLLSAAAGSPAVARDWFKPTRLPNHRAPFSRSGSVALSSLRFKRLPSP